ncbi:MAG: DUF799 family lipoprotein [Deltaproteobacteria bacterium]|nr:DUF799 family lipoprotein [Deltaproteobacteria bacterium]
MRRRIIPAALMVAIGLTGCFWGQSQKPKPQFPAGQGDIRLIAVMPVLNQTQDQEAPRLLRQKVLEALYFKGYPKIPLSVVDDKLKEAFQGQPEHVRANASPREVGRLLGADAVFYLTLYEARITASYGGVSVPVTISATFELKNARTGEVLWQSAQKTVMRQYDVTKKGLEMKASLVYEEAVSDVVQKALTTLPDGPNSLG